MTLTRRAFLGGLASLPAMAGDVDAAVRFDVVVYGATPSGIVAAVAAAREGVRVALVAGGPVGGVSANGLGWTDEGVAAVLGGLCVEVFRRNGKRYGRSYEKNFEPHVIEAVFREMLAEAGVTVFETGTLRRVAKDGRRLTAAVLDTGLILRGKGFVDASYEGDLLASAGCAFAVGRESRAAFGESRAGFNAVPRTVTARTRDAAGKRFALLLPPPTTPRFAADARIQAYTFRVCLTRDPANRVPFSKPEGYEADRYLYEIGRLTPNSRFRPGGVPGGKFDLNGNYFGRSWRWPRATWAERRLILIDHRRYQQGLLYTFANDPRVPKAFRDEVSDYGLPKDEFADNGHWPRQLYVREARRLRGVAVMRQQDCTTEITKAHPIGYGSYSLDCHAVGVFATGETTVSYEGGLGSGPDIKCPPYQIPYECLLPETIDNLLVSVCVSATHVAISSLRMEPQYMIMGEAAGCAAALVAGTGVPAGALAGDITAVLARYGAKVSLEAASGTSTGGPAVERP